MKRNSTIVRPLHASHVSDPLPFEIEETTDHLKVSGELPELRKGIVKVSIDKHGIFLEGMHKPDARTEGLKFYSSESCKQLHVPCDRKVDITVKDGIVTVVVPGQSTDQDTNYVLEMLQNE
jgi:HSP20 family molecular chaperone IbpA